jgi:Tfp pilus assembly protein PilE
MKKYQDGFSLVEGLLIVIIVGMLGGVGYYVWHSQKQVDKTYSQTANSTVAPKQASAKSSPAASQSNYLTIKEWGVKLPLSSDDIGAYYVYNAQTPSSLNSDVWIFDKSIDSTKNLAGKSCKNDGYPLFVIDRVKSSDVKQTSNHNSPYFIEETNINMYKTFSFTKDYQFIGRTDHQAPPPCEEIDARGAIKANSSIDAIYHKVWLALGKSYDGMQAE